MKPHKWYWLLNWLNIIKVYMLWHLSMTANYLLWSFTLFTVSWLFFPADQPFGFLQWFGVVIALRTLSAVLRPQDKRAERFAEELFYKQPYQVEIVDLPVGLCWYGNKLLYYNGVNFQEVYTGNAFVYTDEMRFTPSASSFEKAIQDSTVYIPTESPPVAKPIQENREV